MDPITKVKIINLASIILISLASALFFYFSPARKKENIRISINYFTLMFICMALSYASLVMRPLLDNTLSIALTNGLEVLGVQSFMMGLKWRLGVKQNLLTSKFFWYHLTVFIFIQAVLLNVIFENLHFRNLMTVLNFFIVVLISLKWVKKNKEKDIPGERIMRGGMLATLCLLVYFLVAQMISNSQAEMLGHIAMAQILVVLTLFGSITSLLLSDIIEKHRIESITDSMTDLFNRRYFMEKVPDFFEKAKLKNPSSACIVCDIDHFKKINDEYGHYSGDKALKKVAHILKSTTGEKGVVARFGGEEFIIFLVSNDKELAINLAERLRYKIEKLKLEDNEMNLTASFGLSYINESDSLRNVIKKADDALYRAKRLGRNRVEVFYM